MFIVDGELVRLVSAVSASSGLLVSLLRMSASLSPPESIFIGRVWAFGRLCSESMGEPLLLPNFAALSGGEEPGVVVEIPLSGGDVDKANPMAASAPPLLLRFLLRLEFGLVCIRECLVNSSERENFFEHPGKEQLWGFSPVWVRMWRV